MLMSFHNSDLTFNLLLVSKAHLTLGLHNSLKYFERDDMIQEFWDKYQNNL